MKIKIKILSYVILGLSITGCSTKQDESKTDSPSYTITCNLTNNVSDSAFLMFRTDSSWVKTDSVKIINNSFSFRGKINLPELVNIRLNKADSEISFFIENRKINIQSDADSLAISKVVGSETQVQYEKFADELQAYDEQLSETYENYKKAEDKSDLEQLKKLEAKYDSLENNQNLFIKNYVEKNNASVLSPYVLLKYLIYSISLDELNSFVQKIDKSIEPSIYVQQLKKRGELLSKTVVGKQATNFTMNDTTGNPIELKSLYGNYLLIDFWASWCGPCRKENPNIVKLYKRFHTMGFSILGVSLDEDKARWKKAIIDDKLTWLHVSDLKGWNNRVAKMYSINSIPHSILLDKDGKIIARGLNFEELEAKLTELIEPNKK